MSHWISLTVSSWYCLLKLLPTHSTITVVLPSFPTKLICILYAAKKKLHKNNNISHALTIYIYKTRWGRAKIQFSSIVNTTWWHTIWAFRSIITKIDVVSELSNTQGILSKIKILVMFICVHVQYQLSYKLTLWYTWHWCSSAIHSSCTSYTSACSVYLSCTPVHHVLISFCGALVYLLHQCRMQVMLEITSV